MTSTESPSRPSRQVLAAMKRYRVMAWIVGVGLLALTVATYLDWVVGDPGPAAILGPIHGFLYIGYLVLTADLAYRARWPMGWALLVALAGTIPFLSFVAERWVTRPLRETTES